MRTAYRAWLLATGLLAAPAVAGTAQAAPDVVASVKPVHSLVSAVMAGVGEPRLLVKAGQSPHTHSLTPSDAGALERADLVVWVGPALEGFLERPVRNIVQDDAAFRLMHLEGLTVLRTRAGGAWGEHAHDHGHDDGGSHAHRDTQAEPAHNHQPGHAGAHDHGDGDTVHRIPEDEVDPHVWLDPDNAQLIVQAVAQRLATVDPEHAETYRRNADATAQRIAEVDRQVAETLRPVKNVPYVVFHDAYHYFENHYGTNAVGSITLSPDRTPGAKRLAEIRDKIDELDARCVFREPQFAPDLVETVVENTEAQVATLDPLGLDHTAGPDAYAQTMRDLATDLRGCLSPKS